MSAAADMEHALQLLTERFRSRLRSIPSTARLAEEVRYTLLPGGRGGALHMPGHIHYLAYGRGPSQGGGSGILKAQILAWIQRRGLQPQDNMSIQSLAYLISRKIHREGYGPRPGVRQALESLRQEQQLFGAPARSLALEFLQEALGQQPE